MEGESKDPAWHFHTSLPSKENIPSALRCIGSVFVRQFSESTGENDFVIVKKFIVFPLNLRLRRVEDVVDGPKVEAVVRMEAVKVGPRWECPGVPRAQAFDGVKSRVRSCYVRQCTEAALGRHRCELL